MKPQPDNLANFNEQLKLYYNKYFPHQMVYDWLNYKDGGKNCFKFREFSFTLPGEIYVRYQAFDDAMDLRDTLLYRVPNKIDIGAVYNLCPKYYKQDPGSFSPQQRELVFDIDISDYDDVRNCCQQTDICDKCWPFMKVGAKVLHASLTQEFGFKHILFAFSGRRGFHCWVCDKRARVLSGNARKAIADYFSVLMGGQSIVKRVHLPHGIHPMLNKAIRVIDEHFDELMIENQDFLATDELVQATIDLCEDVQLQNQMKDRCKFRRSSSDQRWATMKSLAMAHKSRKSRFFIQEVQLQCCFPRIDANVTRGFNHLLKLPFCVHPKTGNVCVPIDIDDIDNFELSQVPKLGSTLTPESMEPYIKVMKKFVDNLNQ